MTKFHPEEYKADGGFRVFGLPILLLVLCAAGVALGWVASFIGQWFYLIVIFPVAIGIGLVIVGIFAGRLTKMRSPGIAVVMGLICSAVAISAMHFSDYQRFLGERAKLLEVAPLLENLPPGERDAKTAEAIEALKKVREVDSFARYLNMEATQGVTISRGKAGFNLGYVGTWIYWCVELTVVAVMATLGLVASAGIPFCSACNTWKEDQKFGTLQKRGVDVAALLRSGELDPLKEHSPAKSGGDLVLSASVCPNCKGQSTIVLKLEEMAKNAKGEQEKKEQLLLTYPGDSLAAFEALFEARPNRASPNAVPHLHHSRGLANAFSKPSLPLGHDAMPFLLEELLQPLRAARKLSHPSTAYLANQNPDAPHDQNNHEHHQLDQSPRESDARR